MGELDENLDESSIFQDFVEPNQDENALVEAIERISSQIDKNRPFSEDQLTDEFYSSLRFIIRLANSVQIVSAGPELKNFYLLILSKLPKGCPLIPKFYSLLKALGLKGKFVVEDCAQLLTHCKSESEVCADAMISIFSGIKDQYLDYIGIHVRSYGVFSSDFHTFIIDKVEDIELLHALFEQLINLRSTEPINYNRLERTANLFYDELFSVEPSQFTNLSLFMIRILRVLKVDTICVWITKLFYLQQIDIDIEYVLDTLSASFAKQGVDKPFTTLSENLIDNLSKNPATEFTSKIVTVYLRWVSNLASVSESIIQRMCTIDFRIANGEVARLIPVLADKAINKRSIKQLVTKIVKDTVSVRYGWWYMKTVVGAIRNEKRDGDKIIDHLWTGFGESEKRNNVIGMVINGVKIESDNHKLGERFGFVQSLIIDDGERKYDHFVSLHQFNTTHRIYAEVGEFLALNTGTFSIYYMEGGQEYLLPDSYPLSSLPLSGEEALRLRIDLVFLPKEKEKDKERDASSPGTPFIDALAKSELLEGLFGSMGRDASDSDSEQLFLVFELLGRSYSVAAPNELQKLACCVSGCGWCPAPEMFESGRVLPYALAAAGVHGLPDDAVEGVLVGMAAMHIDRVSLLMACGVLAGQRRKVQLSGRAIKACLIECPKEPVRWVVKEMLDERIGADQFIALLPLTLLKENRAQTREFFEVLASKEIDPAIVDPFFRDMGQYETTYYSEVDETFIALLGMISRTKENFDLVFERLFRAPLCKNPVTPFVHTPESRGAGIGFLREMGCFEEIRDMAERIPKGVLFPVSDDFTFQGHAHIKSSVPTVMTAILQILTNIPRFVIGFLGGSRQSVPPFIADFQRLVARVRYSRAPDVSIDELMAHHSFESILDLSPEAALLSLLGLLDNELMPGSFIGDLFSSRVGGQDPATEHRFSHTVPVESYVTLVDAIEEMGILEYPRILVINLDRRTKGVSREKERADFSFPTFMRGDEKRPDYILSGVVLQQRREGESRYVCITGENHEWYLCDERVDYYDISDVPNWCFGAEDDGENARNGPALLFYVMDGPRPRIEIGGELAGELDRENGEIWAGRLSASNQFSELVMSLYDGSEEREGFFLNSFLNFGIGGQGSTEWTNVVREKIVNTSEGKRRFIKSVEEIGLAQISKRVGSIPEELIDLIVEALKDNKEGKPFDALMEVANDIEYGADENSFGCFCKVLEKYVEVVGISHNGVEEVVKIISIMSIQRPGGVTIEKQAGSRIFEGIACAFHDIISEYPEHAGAVVEGFFNDKFIKGFGAAATECEELPSIVAAVSEMFPEFVSSLTEESPVSASLFKLGKSRGSLEEKDSIEIRERIAGGLISASEEERKKSLETIVPFLGEPSVAVLHFLSSAFIYADAKKPTAIKESTFGHFIVEIAGDAVRVGREDVGRVTEYIKALEILSKCSPSLLARHASDVLELCDLPLDEEMTEAMVEIAGRIAIISPKGAEAVGKKEKIMEYKKGTRMAVQITAAVGCGTYGKGISGGAIEFCLKHPGDPSVEVIVGLLHCGLIPGEYDTALISKSLRNIRLGIALRDSLDTRNKKRVAGIVRTMMSEARNRGFYSVAKSLQSGNR